MKDFMAVLGAEAKIGLRETAKGARPETHKCGGGKCGGVFVGAGDASKIGTGTVNSRRLSFPLESYNFVDSIHFETISKSEQLEVQVLLGPLPLFCSPPYLSFFFPP